MTTEEIIEELFEKKDYTHKNPLEITRVVAWKEERGVKGKMVTVRLKNPNECKGGYLPFENIMRRTKKLAKQFGFLSFYNSELETGSLRRKKVNINNFHGVSLDSYYFKVILSKKMKFFCVKKLTTELLKIYLDAHKDCRDW